MTAATQTGNQEGRTAMSSGASPAEELRYWLANEDWDMSQYTRRWLERTPHEQATDTLAAISEDAQAEPTSPMSRVLTVMAFSGFATSSGISGSGPGARKAGTRAALLLADLGDARAIAPLTRVFDPYGSWQSKYQQQIESRLARYLSAAVDRGEATTRYTPDVRRVVERTWNPAANRTDLSRSLTDLILSAIRYLRAAGGEENAALLRSIAGAQGVSAARQPNRARVKAAAAGA